MDTHLANSPDLGNDRYRLLVDAIADYAIYMLDLEGRVVSWNPGAQRFKGYTADEILGEHFSRFYPSEDIAADKPGHALRTAAGDGRFESEGWRLRKDGSRFWAHVVIDPIRAPDGTLLGYAKITRDLTERRRTEAKLRESEERFRYLVQGVTDYAIYTLDPDGRVASWNTGAQTIKGYAPEEILGEHFSRFYTDEDRAAGEPERVLTQARETGHAEREGTRVRKDGTLFMAHVVIDAMHNEMGELIGFAKVTRDITERQQAAELLARTNAELQQSQKMEAIGRLTGGIAHDFNNLLMAITGSLELLRTRIPEEPATSRLLDNAMQAALRGASLTQRMLAFARKQALAPETLELPGLVGGMLDLLTRSLGPSIEVITDFPPDLPAVVIDANQLELAILNLAVNSKDAMPDGGTLRVSARDHHVVDRPGLAPGHYVSLSIADTGTGMDAETLSHATEPFFTTKGVGKGTGLGLAMVRGLTEQSGGTVTIDSRVGAGTTVTLWLPVSEEAALAQPMAAVAPAAQTRPRKLRVLVVDDDFLVAMNTSTMLEDLGHEVVEVHSGAQALEAIERDGAFDLMLTDQAMPQMTGTSLIAAARERHPGLKVVLATGYAELPPGSEDIPRLGKPFFSTDLERIVSQTIGNG